MDIDLNGLLVFSDLAETGNFSETGRRMGLSQPSVSLMISQLECAVGLVLFERHPAGAKLTPVGTAFLQRAREVCAAYTGFKDGIRSQARRMDGEVRVGLDGSWFSLRLSEVLGDGAMPLGGNVTFETVGDQWAADLEAGRVDAVVAGRFLQEGMTAAIQEAVIHRERGMTIAWHPSFHPFDRENFNFPEVLRTTLLVPDNRAAQGFGGFLRDWCEHAYGMQGANTVIFASEWEAAVAADAGLGVFLAPGDAMARLSGLVHELDSVRTFEFLLPEAYKFGVYCRADERTKEVLRAAAAIGRAGARLFHEAGYPKAAPAKERKGR